MEDTKKRMYLEVYSILQLLGESYIKSLPKTLYHMIEKNVTQKTQPKYKYLSEITPNNTLKQSIDMIALFHVNYWCTTPEEMNDLYLIFKNNEIKKEEEKRKKYNPDDIFKKIDKNQNTDKQLSEFNFNNSLIEYKEPFWVKFKKFIFKLLHKK